MRRLRRRTSSWLEEKCEPDSIHLRDGHRRDTFFPANETHGLVGGGFDAYALRRNAEGCADVFPHRFTVGKDFWCLGDEGGIDVNEFQIFLRKKLAAFFENFQRADIFAEILARRKIIADVGFSHRSEHCVRDGVAKDISIRVAVESVGVRNLDSAKDEWAVFRELVNVVADADQNFKL